MNHSGEVPESSNDTTINSVQKPVPSYNLDDLALPDWVPRALKIPVPPEVRTWRELADYVRANSHILPPFKLECVHKIQHDHYNARPAERISTIPALIPTIKHLPLRAAKRRGRTTLGGAVTANTTKTNSNVRGASQSQGLAQIAIGPRESPPDIRHKEAMSTNLQPPPKEAITAGVGGVPDLSREHPTQVKMNAHPAHPRVLPQLSRSEATNWSAAPGAHREQPSQTWLQDVTLANRSAAPGANREQPSQTWRNQATSVNWSTAPGAHRENQSQASRNWNAAPGAHREHQSSTSRKESVQRNFNPAPGAHREHLSLYSSKDNVPGNFDPAPGAHREHPPPTSKKENVPGNFNPAPGAHREHPSPTLAQETISGNFNASPGAHRGRPPTQLSRKEFSRKEAMQANWRAAPGAHGENSPQVSRKEYIPIGWSASSAFPRQPPSETALKQAIPAKVDVGPATLMRGTSKQKVVSPATAAAFEKAKSASANSAKEAPHRMQRPATRNTAKGDQSLKSESVNLNTKEKEKSIESASSGFPRQPPSETPPKEAIPAKVDAGPATLMRGMSKQRVVSPATAAAFEKAKSASANSAKVAPQRMQKPATRDTAKGDQSLKSESMNLNTNEKAKSIESASSGFPRQPPSETPPKEAIPAKVNAGPATLMRGMHKQKVVSPTTAAEFEKAKSAMANSSKEAPQGIQKPATRDTAKGDQGLKSESVNLNTNEKAKSTESALKGQVIGKEEIETEEKVVTPMGELIDLSIPINARSPPRPPFFHPTQGHYINRYTTAGGNYQTMPALAAIPALIPAKASDLQPAMQSLHRRMPFPALLPPEAPPTLSRNSSSTRSRSPSLHTRSPSPERPKAANPAAPKQAGRWYLVHTDKGVDYVWVQGAQRGDPCPPHLNPVK